MGLPIGWTSIGPTESTHSETPSCPKQQPELGTYSGSDSMTDEAA